MITNFLTSVEKSQYFRFTETLTTGETSRYLQIWLDFYVHTSITCTIQIFEHHYIIFLPQYFMIRFTVYKTIFCRSKIFTRIQQQQNIYILLKHHKTTSAYIYDMKWTLYGLKTHQSSDVVMHRSNLHPQTVSVDFKYSITVNGLHSDINY